MAHAVFARPGEFDRLTAEFRQLNGLANVLARRAAAKAATHPLNMNRKLIFF